MLGDFDDVRPTDIQLRTVGRLLGWRLGLDHVDPRGTVTSDLGRRFLHELPGRRTTITLPTIFTHRDVGNTDCPGNAAYAAMDEIRDIAARFNDPPGAATSRTRFGAVRSTPSGRPSAGSAAARAAQVTRGVGRGRRPAT